VAEANIGAGAWVLHDELYLIKVDSINKAAVLDENGDIRAGAAAAFGEENETIVAKMNWLSNKENPKTYGSMVVYLTKGSDARRLLADRYFHVGGESGTTSVFECRPRPTQCYNCQEIGHKAFQCKNAQKSMKLLSGREEVARLSRQTKQLLYTSLLRPIKRTRSHSPSRDKLWSLKTMSRSWASSWTRGLSTRNISRGQRPKA
jgi:hypothetical protein